MKLSINKALNKLFNSDKENVSTDIAEPSGIEILYHSGAFSKEWYLASNPDVADNGAVPLEHYYFNGHLEGRSPNYLFDPQWYLDEYQDVKAAGAEPLLHYLLHGESEGRKPSLYFDPIAYKKQLSLDFNDSAIVHYLQNSLAPLASPVAEFDSTYYLETHLDIKEAGIDPYQHFMLQGINEKRNPSAAFDLQYYTQAHLNGDESINPFYHYLNEGKALGLATSAPDSVLGSTVGNPVQPNNMASITAAQNAYLKPGPGFEDFKYGERTHNPDVKAIAYYLPQFHPFKENSEWWGEGFTEWTNVARARSRFDGHYQPHLPRDLGFYDLRLKETLVAQANMARNAGLEGFCFYHYWFNGKRLMEGPANMLLANDDIDLPFCLMWANENWTRTWDGLENDVLMAQDYLDEDDEAFVADIARHFADERYITLDGRPIFFIYRPGIIPNAKEKIALWRTMFNDNHGFDPIIYMAQAFDDIDPRVYALDGAIEFPPHKVAAGLDSRAQSLTVTDLDFMGHYPSYDEMVERSINDTSFDYDVIKAVTPMWDNEARKPNKGMGFIGSTPEKYQNWLASIVDFSKKNPVQGSHSLVCINAWNEWAEGAHLEPDQYWGSAYLNATYRAMNNEEEVKGKYTLLLVGHDAYKHGAQLLTLNIFKTLKQQFGIDVKVALLSGGPLVEEYEKIGDTYVCDGDVAKFEEVVIKLKQEAGLTKAICNTTVTGRIASALNRQNITFISLIHELKNLIKEYGLEGAANDIASHAEKIIFAAQAVQDSFVGVIDNDVSDKLIVHPQGIYQELSRNNNAAKELRTRLSLDSDAKVVVNVGYADLRKGFDIFVNTAKVLVAQDPSYHFLWIGDIEPSLKHWLASDLESDLLVNNFHNIPFTNEISLYLEGSNVFAMTSREDPFPSVVMESLALGTPVVGFTGGGGFTELLDIPLNGQAVPMADIQAMAAAIAHEASSNTKAKEEQRINDATNAFKWSDYVFSLVEYLDPSIKRVSVAVPNYNYEHHIEERLRSIFDQAYPIYEINILDDKSPDNSVEVINNYICKRQRIVNLVVNEENSGSVFKQWKKGADLAKAEYLWIAEADDSADQFFLSKILSGDKNFDLAYTDSVQIDEKSQHLADDYRYYYDAALIEKLDNPKVYAGREFIEDCLAVKNQFMNVSAVLFNTNSIQNCLNDNINEILKFKVAGDWYIYVQMLSRKTAKVKVLGESLNVHRRHSGSVTHRNYDVQLKEIERIQKDSLQCCQNKSEKEEVQSEYLVEVKKVLEG